MRAHGGEVEVGRLARLDGDGELASAEVAATEHAAIGTHKDKLDAALALAPASKRCAQKCGERNGPAAVALRGVPHQLATRGRDSLGDFDTAAQHVEPADLEGGHLPPAQPRVREEQNNVAVLITAVGKLSHLGVAEVAAMLLHYPRKLHTLT